MGFREILRGIRESKEYDFRIKFAEKLTDEKVNKLERVLDKYDLIELTGPTETIVQEHPLDFQDIDNAEIYIFTAKVALPASPYILLQEIKNQLDIPEKFIVVRTDNDPSEIETEVINAKKDISKEARSKNLEKGSYLSTSRTYPEHEQLEAEGPVYGDEHLSNFKKYLAMIAATRKNNIIEPHDSLYDYDEEVQDAPQLQNDNDFNAHIEDAPKIYNTDEVEITDDPMPHIRKNTSEEGNYDEDNKKVSKIYKTEKGKMKVLSRETNSIRAGGKK